MFIFIKVSDYGSCNCSVNLSQWSADFSKSLLLKDAAIKKVYCAQKGNPQLKSNKVSHIMWEEGVYIDIEYIKDVLF